MAGEGGDSGAIGLSAMLGAEEAVEALVEHLISPLLPMKESKKQVPTDPQQEIVAKQMHATVMLYNYYHRKQFPHLEFLHFESFCKVACIAKPGLLMYLKYMHRCEEGLKDPDSQLSITEKTVMDACNTCVALDASKESPNMEGWPISKVAVFLIDPTKERCLLQYCSITQGVWSTVEKDLETPLTKLVDGPQKKRKHVVKNKESASGSSENESSGAEDVLKHLAFSAVEQKSGIRCSSLSILESGLTYSLSQEKTVAQFYIMKYEEALSEELTEVPIKDVMSSLKGPPVKKGLIPDVTSVVDYYHLLPYIDIISDWLSRETPHDGSLYFLKHKDVDEKHSLELGGTTSMENHETSYKSDMDEQRVYIQSHKIIQTESEVINKKRNDLSSISGSSRAVSRPQNINGVSRPQNIDGVSRPENIDSGSVEPNRLARLKDDVLNDQKVIRMIKNETDIINQSKNDIPSINGSSKAVDRLQSRVDRSSVESDGLDTVKAQEVNEEKVNIHIQKMFNSENDIRKNSRNDLLLMNGSTVAGSIPSGAGNSSMEADRMATIKDHRANVQDWQDGDILTSENNILTSKNDMLKSAITNNKIVGESGMSESTEAVYSYKADSPLLGSNQKPSQKDENIRKEKIISGTFIDKREKNAIHDGASDGEGGSKDKAGFLQSAKKPYMTKCIIEESLGRRYASDGSHDGVATKDLPIVPSRSSSDNNDTPFCAMASRKNDLLQASSQILQKKRNELCQQQRLLEDEIALCEMNLQTILLEGKENLTQKVESIIEACNVLCSSQRHMDTSLGSAEQCLPLTIKKRRLSEAVLSLKSPCQELDDICCMNSWILPRYSVLPSYADGKFQASITLRGMDFECTVGGDLLSSPREARASAAAYMLIKLRSMAGKEQ